MSQGPQDTHVCSLRGKKVLKLTSSVKCIFEYLRNPSGREATKPHCPRPVRPALAIDLSVWIYLSTVFSSQPLMSNHLLAGPQRLQVTFPQPGLPCGKLQALTRDS